MTTAAKVHPPAYPQPKLVWSSDGELVPSSLFSDGEHLFVADERSLTLRKYSMEPVPRLLRTLSLEEHGMPSGAGYDPIAKTIWMITPKTQRLLLYDDALQLRAAHDAPVAGGSFFSHGGRSYVASENATPSAFFAVGQNGVHPVPIQAPAPGTRKDFFSARTLQGRALAFYKRAVKVLEFNGARFVPRHALHEVENCLLDIASWQAGEASCMILSCEDVAPHGARIYVYDRQFTLIAPLKLDSSRRPERIAAGGGKLFFVSSRSEKYVHSYVM
ncbi:MAG TPA: hypothetical protein DDW80_05255 [Desulfovibrio sp.]|nr:hypothetical protein [Desulfovibrio sp.]